MKITKKLNKLLEAAMVEGAMVNLTGDSKYIDLNLSGPALKEFAGSKKAKISFNSKNQMRIEIEK